MTDLCKEKPCVKSYCGGKPNYCTPVDVFPKFIEPKVRLSTMKPGDRFILVRTGVIYRIEKDGSQWNETRQRPGRLHKNSHVQLIVDAVNISQEPVDETAKCKHEWVGITEDEAIELYEYSATEWQFAQAIEARLKEKNNG